MRSIVCRFKDEADFLDHLEPGRGRRAPTFTLVTELDLAAGTGAELVGIVSRVREELRVDVTIFEKTTIGVNDTTANPLYRYVCAVSPSDVVWVEMFTQKLSLMSGMRAAA